MRPFVKLLWPLVLCLCSYFELIRLRQLFSASLMNFSVVYFVISFLKVWTHCNCICKHCTCILLQFLLMQLLFNYGFRTLPTPEFQMPSFFTQVWEIYTFSYLQKSKQCFFSPVKLFLDLLDFYLVIKKLMSFWLPCRLDSKLKTIYLINGTVFSCILFLLFVGVQRLWRISAFTAAMVITMGTYFTVLSKASWYKLAIP